MANPILEIQNIGNFVKVIAVDPETGIEASASGPAGVGELHVRQLALRKLENLLKKSAQ